MNITFMDVEDHENKHNFFRIPQVESSNMSTISDSSIDYMTRFEELAESMKNESNNIVTP